MKAGFVISAVLHGGVLALALLGMPDRAPDEKSLPARISDVSLISLDEFQARTSTAPVSPAEDVQAALAEPAPEDEPKTPEIAADTAPELASSAAIERPEVETAPDLSTFEVTDPDVVTELSRPTASDDAPVGLDTPLMDAPRRDGSVNSTQTALLAPSTPHLAPRIDTTAAPRPPDPVPEAPAPQEDVAETPQEAPEPAPEIQPQDAAAPKEATTEIAPDAVAQDSPLAPVAAALPKGRPRTIVKEDDTADAEEAQSREERLAAAIRAANDAQENAQASNAPQGARLGADFSFGEQQAVGAVIGKRWNKGLIEGKDNFERLVVTVRVQLFANGKVMGNVEPVDPANPSGDFKVAYDAARRAVLRAQPIPLPKDKFSDGDYLEIRFDPGRSAVVMQ